MRDRVLLLWLNQMQTLYDLDYETDHIALIQSLLLMTYREKTLDDLKCTRHWLDTAISFAYRIGLHRITEQSKLNLKRKGLLKRIWWSCFIKDRLVALEARGPIGIQDDDYETPMLILEDFNIEAISSNNCIISSECTLIRDTTMQTDLAKMCVAKANLCLCIGRIISVQYPLLSRDYNAPRKGGLSANSSLTPSPRKSDRDHEEKVQCCDSELSDWLNNLPKRYIYSKTSAKQLEKDGYCIFLQQCLLNMMYFAALSALHEPQSLPLAELVSHHRCCDSQDISTLRVHDASKAIVAISLDLHSMGLESYLPATVVAVMVLAVTRHLLGEQSFSGLNGEDSIGRFYHCMRLLEEIKDTYPAAEYTIHFLNSTIRKPDLDIAVENMTDSSDIFKPTTRCSGVTLPEKDKILTQNVSLSMASKSVAKWKPFSGLGQSATDPHTLTCNPTRSINRVNCSEDQLQSFSLDDPQFPTISSLHCGKLPYSDNDLGSIRTVILFDGIEDEADFETFFNFDMDDCESSLCSRSECGDLDSQSSVS
jgi:hypothetical protein